MKTFINDDFLLQSDIAGRLYHDHVKTLPIIDYHNHLPPEQIANDHIFKDITEVWLDGDHYKWRAMRANGINEKFITGSASNKEKFLKWCETVPATLRNPLYHWTHLELKRYFNIDDLLGSSTAESVYNKTSELLATSDFSTNGLLRKMNVESLCTTDHPCDSLEFHKAFGAKQSNFKLLPTFRPDQFLNLSSQPFLVALEKLEIQTNSNISSYDELVTALAQRITYFHDAGCRLSDHGLSFVWVKPSKRLNLDAIIQKRKDGGFLTEDEDAAFGYSLLCDLSEMYHEHDWVMQLHLGAQRDNNPRLIQSIGSDVGCDSIGDWRQAEGLAGLLGELDQREKLPKTILYNLNPADNEVFATMAGNFNDGITPGKIQWGSGWWFLDQKDGMQKQINTLSNMGLLSKFVGMLTDSRSFLSFPRHEYFRRILCNLIGQDVVKGELPNDEVMLSDFVKNISYYNAKQYFNL